MMSVCPHCNAPIPRDSSRFCNQCGVDLRSLSRGSSEQNLGIIQSSRAVERPEEGVILNGSPFNDPPSMSIMAAPQDENKPQKPAATLHILQRDGSVIEREVLHEETKIGKGHLNDVILADASVSSSHAKINFTNNEYTISDLGSRNGTYLNDSRLTQPRALHHGDLIKMGHCTLTFRIKEVSDTESVPRTRLIDMTSPPPPPAPPPTPSIPAINEVSLAAALVSSGLVAQSEIDRFRSKGDTVGTGLRLCRTLLDEHLVSEIALRDLMSRTFNIPPIKLNTIDVDPEAAPTLRPEFLRERLVIPVVGQGVDRSTLAIADPTDRSTIDQVERMTKKKAALRLATPTEIITRIDSYFTPRLIGVTPSGEKIDALLNHPEIEIGKASHNRLVISDPTVSATHAIVLSSHGGYSVVDLGSSNGTFINDTRLGHDAHTLQHGDKIQLGQVLLTFRNPAETTEHKTARLTLEALEDVRRRAAFRSPQVGVQTDPSAWNAIQSAGVVPGSDSGKLEEKSEKKKKKKEKDKNSWFNPNALSRILAQVLGASVMLLGTYYLISRDSKAPRETPPETITKLSEPGAFTPFQTAGIPLEPGLPLEASGVAWVKQTNQVLMVSDAQPGKVILMSLDEMGRQTVDLSLVDLGVSAIDPEGITYGNSYFYIIGSQSDPNAGQQNALLRFAFDPETRKLREPAQVITDLRSFLLQNVNELKGPGEKPGKQGGLNIEGICWDPVKERLLLGLRSPLIDNEAMIVTLKLRDPLGPFAIDNLMTAEPQTIKLNLDGHGIRDIDFNPELNSFLILSGATELARRENFGLWEWKGGTGAPRQENELDERAKPEGITHVSIDGRKFVFIVGDSGKYLRLDYKSLNR